MGHEEIINYWLETAEEDFDTMIALYENRRFPASLFFGHLVLEKLLKGIYAKQNPKNPTALKTHNLLLLAKKCNLSLEEKIEKQMDIISGFNMDARYDDLKREFNKLCTKEFTSEWIANIKELREWLKKLITK